MRNLDEVLIEMMELIPDAMTSSPVTLLKNDLSRHKDSSEFAPPEGQSLFWREAALSLADYFGDKNAEPKEGWEKDICTIFAGPQPEDNPTLATLDELSGGIDALIIEYNELAQENDTPLKKLVKTEQEEKAILEELSEVSDQVKALVKKHNDLASVNNANTRIGMAYTCFSGVWQDYGESDKAYEHRLKASKLKTWDQLATEQRDITRYVGGELDAQGADHWFSSFAQEC